MRTAILGIRVGVVRIRNDSGLAILIIRSITLRTAGRESQTKNINYGKPSDHQAVFFIFKGEE